MEFNAKEYLGLVAAARKFGVGEIQDNTITQSFYNLRKGHGSVSPAVAKMPSPDIVIVLANGSKAYGWDEANL